MPIKLKLSSKLKRKKAAREVEGGWDTASVSSSASKTDRAAIVSLYHVQKEKAIPKLHRAVWKGNITKVRKLTVNMKKSELNSTDKEKRTALHFACAGKHEDIISHLCTEVKADPNIKDNNGNTPLLMSVKAGCTTSCITTLIEAGGRVNEADRQGRTPLHEAAERGRNDVITLLRTHRADIEAMEMNGCTALHLAAKGGHSDTVSQLIRDGADINKTDGQGHTALMLSASEGDGDILRLLYEARADPEVRDETGLGATDHALRNNHQSCAKMMEDYKLQCARESPYDHKTSLHTTPQSPTHTSQSTQHIPPPSQHQHSQESQKVYDESWNSESEVDDVPDGPLGNIQTPGRQSIAGGGGFNLREAMAKAKLPPVANGRDAVKVHQSVKPHPQSVVKSHQECDDILSDWDDDEQSVDSAHIPSMVGASKETSVIQHERMEGGSSEVGIHTTVAGGMGMNLDDDSIPSTESESDLPMFGDYKPSAGNIPSTPQLPAINQGHTPQLRTSIPSPSHTTGVEIKEEEEEEDDEKEEDSFNTAATRRKCERDNEFLLTFQARQNRKTDIKPNQTTSPDSMSTSVSSSNNQTNNVPSNPGSGSKVQVMKEQWEKGMPLKLAPFNDPVVGVARKIPETCDNNGEGSGGGGESGAISGDGDGDGDGSGGGESISGDGDGDGSGGDGESGAISGDGSGDGSGGGDGDKKHDSDKDEESEEEEEKEGEKEEEEEREVRVISSTTPLIEPASNESGLGQILTTPTHHHQQSAVQRRRDSSSQSDPWDIDSSSNDLLLPTTPPILHSTPSPTQPLTSLLKLATPSHTTPHYTTLTNTASDEGGMAEVKGQSSATPTLEPKSHDQPPKSHDHSGEMSPSHLSSTHHSLFDSTHLSHLATSLYDQHSLSRSQRSIRSVERRLQAQLDDTHQRLNEVTSSRQALETSTLDQELKLRELEYQLQQERETVKSDRMTMSTLREQLAGLEERLSREMEQRQSAELQRRDAELRARSNHVTSQQLQEQLTEITSRLQAERECRAVQEGLYKEQMRLSQELQNESTRVHEQKMEVKGRLELANSSRQNLEEQLQRLQKENTKLQVELSGERCRGEEVRGRLEGEVQETRERLREKNEKLITAEDALLASQQQFECALDELHGKVNSLSSGLDTETSVRKQVQSERDQFKSQLDKATRTLQAITRRSAAKEKELLQAVEVQRREREIVERDLAGSRVRLEQLAIQSSLLETKLNRVESERGDHAGAVIQWTNQIAALKKEAEQWQQRTLTLEENLKNEKTAGNVRNSELISREREVSSLQNEVVRLTEQLMATRQRLEEKEDVSKREQTNTHTMIESLKIEYDITKSGLEEKCRNLTIELQTMREDGIRREGEGKEREKEIIRLQSLLKDATLGREKMEDELRRVCESCEMMKTEKKRGEETASERDKEVKRLNDVVMRGEHEIENMNQQLIDLHNHLTQSEVRIKELTAQYETEERRKSEGEGEIKLEQKRVNELEQQVRKMKEREERLQREIDIMKKERTGLQETMSRIKGEAIKLQEEREALQVAVQLSQREAAEARGLWETEIKSRASMSIRLLQLEKSQQEIAPTIETEKRLTHDALEQKKISEYKYETLQEHCTGLERELGEMRVELRETRRRLEEKEGGSSHILTLQQQLEHTQQRLVHEADVRMRAEQTANQTSIQLETMTTHRDTINRDKEVRRLQKANHHLEEEIKRLGQTMNHVMVDRRVMESAIKRAEDEAHFKLSKKLQEVNSHLQQQSLVHSNLQRRTEVELRGQIEQLQRQVTQTNKYKELYEVELGRRERLEERVREAEQTMAQAESKARFERSRMQYLLSNSTQQPHPHPHHPHHPHTFTTSTPHKTNLTGSATDQLLNSIRSELDRSITKHLASVPQPMSTKNSSQQDGTHGQTTQPIRRSSLSTSRHLDSIRRNYHI